MAYIRYHVGSSLVAAGVVYSITRSMAAAVACLGVGVFIDLDHVPDYFAAHGIKLNARAFLRACYEGRFARLLLLAHSWELVIVIAIVSWWSRFNPIVFGVFVGFAVHMLFDQFADEYHPFRYFLVFRIYKRFTTDIFKARCSLEREGPEA